MSKQNQKRLTIDIPASDHTHLKLICATLGMSMRDFVTHCVANAIEQFEDEMDLKMAKETLARIERGEEEVISWEEMKRSLGWDKL